MVNVLLTLIFIRPFISSLAFPCLNALYSFLLLGFLLIWIIVKGMSLEKIRYLKYPLICFSLALVISLTFSPYKLNSLVELYKYVGGLLLLIIIASLEQENKIRVIRTLVFSGLLISLLAIYQYLFGFQHILDYVNKNNINNPFILEYIERKRVFFPFVTPNALAGYLAMIIPLALTDKKYTWSIVALFFALLLTKSLGALFSLSLAMGLYFYLQQDKLKKKITFSLFGLLVIIISLVFVVRLSVQKQHLKPIFSTLMRLNYWKDSLILIKDKPLTGVGPGNFNLVESRYSHNSYLQVLAEMGVSGLITLLWIIFLSLRIGFNKLKKTNNRNYIAGLLSANISFLIHNLIDFTFFLPEVSVIWWIILGLS